MAKVIASNVYGDSPATYVSVATI